MIAKVQQQKPVYCISAETGSLVFAILNIVVAILASIITLVVMIAGLCVQWTAAREKNIDISSVLHAYRMILDLTTMNVTVITMISSVSLMFAAFLLNGIRKRKPEHVKAYFVYGVVVDVLAIVASKIFLLLTFGDIQKFVIAFVSLIICVIYTLILVMIHHTYRKFENMKSQYDHQKLEEAPEKY